MPLKKRASFGKSSAAKRVQNKTSETERIGQMLKGTQMKDIEKRQKIENADFARMLKEKLIEDGEKLKRNIMNAFKAERRRRQAGRKSCVLNVTQGSLSTYY
ncbi:hypothetical protein AVEN_167847-1 [Araneus ventricosus]|uniref:Uncharacterized protein n=1 Tax=Araneus ventricosus TaxID=182803 RepID=A0A4Y2I0E0_ARAVE|nr:hypothetical protein AVEN_187330-1 [Araneus ventricosus]GBN24869.1 hypothetical protein AVEN_167847-1 [Araneus ventricosus]